MKSAAEIKRQIARARARVKYCERNKLRFALIAHRVRQWTLEWVLEK
jgi:hypothetical protein